MKDDAKSISFVEDTAVAPEKLRDYIERFLADRARPRHHGRRLRARVGRLPARAAGRQPEDRGGRRASSKRSPTTSPTWCSNSAARFPASTATAWCAARSCGRCSATALYEAFREIKRTFDPHGIFNPGKIVDAPPLTSNLRFGAGYQTPNPATFFDYSEYGGMGGAVEMCSGVGACRKKLAGTMCPSYMATRDETDSTRGRANVLRLAMAGRLGESGLGDQGVYDVLDLCLECRACKAECPVGVDMARFKSEFLADYWTPPRHAAARARAGRQSRMRPSGAAASPRFRTGSSSTRSPAMKAAGHRSPAQRCPPGSARRSRTGPRTHQAASASRPPVTLFNDTFTNHYDPEIGIAARRGSGARRMLASTSCAPAAAAVR